MPRVPTLNSRLRRNDEVVIEAQVVKYKLPNVLLRTALAESARYAVYTLPLDQITPQRHSRVGGNLNRELGALTIAQLQIRYVSSLLDAYRLNKLSGQSTKHIESF